MNLLHVLSQKIHLAENTDENEDYFEFVKLLNNPFKDVTHFVEPVSSEVLRVLVKPS